jgi:hypothetical protein
MLPERFTLAPWKKHHREFGLRRSDPPCMQSLAFGADRNPVLFGIDDRGRVAAPFRGDRAEHELALDALEHRARCHRQCGQRREQVSHPSKFDRIKRPSVPDCSDSV